MICHQPLSVEQRIRSQRNVCRYSAINGISYMCLGETVMLLLAVKLGMPDWAVSALSSMIFFGYAMLPLGKWVTARVGAAKCQADFWVARNVVAVGVASSVIWEAFGWHRTAFACVLLGAFTFYGFRAAGVVMSVPLIGNITVGHEREKILGESNGYFNIMAALALVGVTFLTRWKESEWMLFGIILFGAFCGVTASGFLRHVDETDAVMRHAAKPFLKDLKPIFRDSAIRRMILGRMCANLAILMTVGLSMLTLKRGYGISDSNALFFTLICYIVKSVMSPGFSWLAKRIGSRNALLTIYCCGLLAAVLWIFAPGNYHFCYALLIFLCTGTLDIGCEVGKSIYILQCVPEEKLASASVLVSLFDGALVGLFAIFLNSILLKTGSALAGDTANALLKYRLYFLMALPILILAFCGVWRMKPMETKRR